MIVNSILQLILFYFLDWITALGPATYGDDGLYEWAIVTERNKLYNFVLVRDVEDFKQNYETEVFRILRNKGMNCPWNFLWATSQDDCQYPPRPDQ